MRARFLSPLLARAAAAALGALPSGLAQPPPRTTGPLVTLPPYVVTDKAVPWLYVKLGRFEVLSRCSDSATREFVRKLYKAYQMLDRLLPDTLRMKLSVPASYILYGSDMVAAVPREMLKPMEKAAAGRIDTPPNLMLFDRDRMEAATLYQASQSGFEMDPDNLRFLIGGRAPPPPPWFLAGFTALYRRAVFKDRAVTFAPLDWDNEETTQAILRNAETPRRLIPIEQLFAAYPPQAKPADALLPKTWEAEAALLMRWAFDEDFPDRKEKLLKFVGLAGAAPPATQEQFEACFGYGYSELLDRLSDTLPSTVETPLELKPRELPAIPRFELRKASPAEVGRIKGDWERLEARWIRTQFPAVAGEYLARARKTLADAHAQSPNDADLLAVMGLCEIDAGNRALAREYLESAAKGHAVGPLVYSELARLRYDALVAAPTGSGGLLSAGQAAAIAEPVLIGRTQYPPLAEEYEVLDNLWLHCSAPIPQEQIAAIRDGARLFPMDLRLLYLTAVTESGHGLIPEAAELAAQGMRIAPTDAAREHFGRLKAALETAAGPAPGPASAGALHTASPK